MTRYPDGVDPIAFHALSPSDQQLLGAAVLTEGGQVITGSNVENAAYGPSICAERSALIRANAEGLSSTCVALAVVARNGDSPTGAITAPCGVCRQVIYEFSNRSALNEEFKIILATTNFEEVVVTNIGKLLPLAFGPKD